MNLDIWMSWYELILEEFGFSRVDDERSAEILSKILKEKNGLSPHDINIKKDVIVFGAGPSLKKNISEIKELKLDKMDKFTIIAADGATSALLEEDIIPDIIVTDLDGKMDDITKANKKGSFLVVHAHGDNIDKIKRYVPMLSRVLGTTQSTPPDNVYNFGGFTDGDRGVFLAIAFGARFIILAGMDFGDRITRYSRPDLEELEGKADEIKYLKLEFAKKLIEWAGRHENVRIVNISKGEEIEGVVDFKNQDVRQIENYLK
ncbi:MAG: DUF115 domain-containing protein [Euryarchaeota archaeon]|nr:DUF115 domain-containing protein [Euryarchaeota archaeon]